MELSQRLWQGRLLPRGVGACLAAGYKGGLSLRERCYQLGLFKTRQLNIPVISIGNLTVGGTGKTPTTMALASLFSKDLRVAVVSRGYKRHSAKDPLIVSDGVSILASAVEGGDEPYLMAKQLQGVSVVVGSDRYEAASLAVKELGAQVIILDDGFQNRRLRKDLELLLVDGQSGFGNGRLLPAGPLREPLEAVGRADAILIVKRGSAPVDPQVSEILERLAPGIPIFGLDISLSHFQFVEGEPISIEVMRGKRAVAFCGIGNSQAFFRGLEEVGITLLKRLSFPDHHRYRNQELAKIATLGKGEEDLCFITTEKDLVNMPGPPYLPNLLVAELSVGVPEGVVEIVKRAVDAYYAP